MRHIPNKIFLQIGLEEYGETCEDFNELSNISWCADKIYDDDLEYISVSSVLRRIKELEDTTTHVSAIINELKLLFNEK